jgi:hypothetical protein
VSEARTDCQNVGFVMSFARGSAAEMVIAIEFSERVGRILGEA